MVYRPGVPGERTNSFERTPEELAAEHNLDDEQLMWRRRKIAQNGKELFQQEYPATPDQAFLTTGRPVFNLTAAEMLPKPEIARKAGTRRRRMGAPHSRRTNTDNLIVENNMSLAQIQLWASEMATSVSRKCSTVRNAKWLHGVDKSS